VVPVDDEDVATAAVAAPPEDCASVAPIGDGEGPEGVLESPGEKDCFAFAGEAGDRITAFVDNRTTGAGWESQLVGVRLLAPDGAEVARHYPGGCCRPHAALEEQELPEDGTYTLVVEGQGATTGPYKLAFFKPPYRTTPIADGEGVERELALPGEAHGFTFEGKAGDRITAFVDNRTTGPGWESQLVGVRLVGPGGAEVARHYPGGCCRPHAALEEQELPEDGTYTLVVKGQGATTGPYKLAFFEPPYRTTVITEGKAVERELVLPGEAHGFTFDGEAGERITAFVDNRTTGAGWESQLVGVRLLAPDGAEVARHYPGGCCRPNAALEEQELPADGPYTLVVEGEGATTGPYVLVFSLLSMKSPPGETEEASIRQEVADWVPIADGEIVQRELVLPGEAHGYTFEGEAGERITVFVANHTTGGNRELSLRLLGPDGGEVASRWGTRGGNVALRDRELPDDGAHTLVIEGRGDATGRYTLTFFKPSYRTTAIADGAEVEAALALPGEAHGYGFDGAAGERITAFVDNRMAGTRRVRVRLLGPHGTEVASARSNPGDDVVLKERVLPEGGAYTLVIVGIGTATGPYTLTFFKPPYDTKPIADSEAIERQLALPGETHDYTFKGEAGERIRAFMANHTTGGNRELSLRLLGPDGAKVASARSHHGGADAALWEQVLPRDGSYTLTVDGVGDATGPYTLSFLQPAHRVVAAIEDGAPVEGELALPGEAHAYTFDGEAGEQVTAFLDNRTTSGTTRIGVRLLGPDGAEVASARSHYGGADTALWDQALPEDGTYTLVVEGVADATGPYILSFFKPPYRTTVIADSESVEAELALPREAHGYTFEGKAGERITAFVANHTTGGSRRLSLRLLGPDGTEGAGTSPYAGQDVALREQELARDGTYTVVVQGHGDATGPYTFTFFHPPSRATELEDAAPIEGELGLPGEAHVYLFEGSADDRVTVFVADRTTGGDRRLRLRLLEPDGAEVADTWNYAGRDVALREQELARDGTYTVVVQGGDATGSYVLSFFRPSYHTAPIVDGEEVERELALPGEAHGYTFEGKAGERITAFVANRTTGGSRRLSLRLLGPDGTEGAGTSPYAGRDVALREQELARDGTYTVVVQGRGDATGPYILGFSQQMNLLAQEPGIRLEVASWVPERTSDGWWGAVPTGGSPDERVNWSNRYDALVLPPATYDVYWVQEYAKRGRPLLLASGVEVEPGEPATIDVDTGIRLEVAGWVPTRSGHGWWGAVPAGAGPDERVNWSNRYDALVLPPGTYDVYWVQEYAKRGRPLLLASGVEVEPGAPATVGVDTGVAKGGPPPSLDSPHWP
jgi:hypothetical protein